MVGGHLPQPYPKRSQWIGNRQCFVSPYAPILSASGFGVGFGYLNTFSKGIWSTRLLHVFKYIQLKIYQISAITCPYINCKFRSKVLEWNHWPQIGISFDLIVEAQNPRLPSLMDGIYKGTAVDWPTKHIMSESASNPYVILHFLAGGFEKQ